MLNDTRQPLRNIARAEPLEERARRLSTVPTEIPKTTVDAMDMACQTFLTTAPGMPPPAPAPDILYKLNGAGDTYLLQGRASDITPQQRYGILKCLKLPNGIRMLRVQSVDSLLDTAVLEVHFFNTNFLSEIVTTYIADHKSAKSMLPISGGHRVTAGSATGQVQVDSSPAPPSNAISLPNADEPMLLLSVKPVGDYSTYVLSLSSSKITSVTPVVFDPLFAEISFKFRPGCFSLNCKDEGDTPPAPLPEPTIDYLAKDFESFRLTMIAAMMERVPEWQASSEADLDQVLLELFSAAADELSDYQDRVMNEAYLATCRKRVSLARHARLMDYHIHQGNQASTWLALELDHMNVATSFDLSDGLRVWSGRKKEDEASVVFISRDEDGLPPPRVHQLLNSLSLYTWSDSIPALAAGSTSADLRLFVAFYPNLLVPENVPATDQASALTVQGLIRDGFVTQLLIQERLNPTTGVVAGRDPGKRQLLHLLPGLDGAEALRDPITNEWFVRVRWAAEDALQRSYCFTIECDPPVGKVENISLFHGNLVEVFHGRPQRIVFKDETEQLTSANEFYYERTERWGTLCRLPGSALAYRNTPPGGEVAPRSTLIVEVTDKLGAVPDPWDEVPNLIHSGTSDENGDHFVVETDELRRSLIRFGSITDGANGKELPEEAVVICRYQTGDGLEGNIGADMLTNFKDSTLISNPANVLLSKCWNPFDITNGRAPEPAAEIIRRVPEAFRARQLRAVTLQDYVKRAEEVPEVARAAASYAWTGSWRTVRLTIDPRGTNVLTDKTRRKVARYIEAVRLIGEDIELRPPRFVPLDIKVVLCAAGDHWPEDLSFALDEEFSSGWTSDGRRGFFHPDLWTFGQPLYASQIIGRAMLVEGVEHVVSVKIKRWNDPTAATDYFGNLRPSEIIQVLTDPDHMELGFISFEVKGGRG